MLNDCCLLTFPATGACFASEYKFTAHVSSIKENDDATGCVGGAMILCDIAYVRCTMYWNTNNKTMRISDDLVKVTKSCVNPS